MNIDEALIEDAITVKTKAIVPVHYAGISCEMDTILDIANRYNLIVIEDAAQGFGAFYKNKMLGSLGDIGCYSFHETKNVTCGEGGAILIKNKENSDRAEIIREKGTNRSKFLRGEIDKYTWVDIGSSYLPSEINAAFLYTQLQNADMINKNRIKSWNIYYEHLKPLEKKGYITLPHTPDECKHNGHIFYIKTGSLEQREKLIGFLRENNICTAFHYIPLHSSPAGQSFGRYHGTDKWTTKESECLLRLPLFFNLDDKSIDYICEKIDLFFKKA
jgi:dTDP-4-amino-4,6-dideoxygalactose transaminase